MQGIGLLGLLVVVALIFYLMFGAGGSGSVGAAKHVQDTVKPQVEQISGRDSDGKLATESITFDAGARGVTVNTVVPGGAFDQKFGLKPDDVIVEIGPLARDQFQDNSTAKAYLHDAYARGETLVVQRGTQRIKLPDDRNVGVTPPAQPQAQTPAAETPAAAPPPPPVQRTTPRNQLEGILKGRQDNDVPTH